MSASLVGSEMCIRDSCMAPSGSIGHRRVLSGAVGRRRVFSGALGRRAVSYTHLTLPTICSV
eukprot:5695381-Alexandrium_andersonii.AAC.1